MKKELGLLRMMVWEGFFLHGSRQKIKKPLEPRQAKDAVGKPSGCQMAVYATKSDIRIPCIMAMFTPIDPGKASHSEYSRKTGGKMVVTGENVTFGPGYVYVLPADTFEEMDGEFISFKPVMPILVIPVNPKILRLFPNLEIQIPVPAEW
jgi:hypothetical protein